MFDLEQYRKKLIKNSSYKFNLFVRKEKENCTVDSVTPE